MIKNYHVTIEQDFKDSILSDLNRLNTASQSIPYIFTIASTLHHETGEPAYIPGYHPLRECPDFTLVQSGDMTIGLFMDIVEAARFNNSVIGFEDGYVVMRNLHV
jgi:hypothetical protein